MLDIFWWTLVMDIEVVLRAGQVLSRMLILFLAFDVLLGHTQSLKVPKCVLHALLFKRIYSMGHDLNPTASVNVVIILLLGLQHVQPALREKQRIQKVDMLMIARRALQTGILILRVHATAQNNVLLIQILPSSVLVPFVPAMLALVSHQVSRISPACLVLQVFTGTKTIRCRRAGLV
jgi:hypothetical protein